MKQHTNLALILAATALAACGGGGTPASQQPAVGQQPTDGQQPTVGQQPTTDGQQPTDSQQPSDSQQPAGGQQPSGGQQGAGAEGTVRPADLARTLDNTGGTARISEKARVAANAIPRMGSVTQSSNTDSSGVTTDTASATFDGSQLSLTVAHQDGTSTQVAAPISAFVSTSEDSVFQGHSSGQWMLGSEESDRYSALIAMISYSSTSPSDWLAGGLLITADGSGGPVGAGDVNQIAWIDGPEVSGKVDLTGASRSAVYTGTAIGNYTATSGGSLEVGAFQSPFQITANFDASSISGCVGCG